MMKLSWCLVDEHNEVISATHDGNGNFTDIDTGSEIYGLRASYNRVHCTIPVNFKYFQPGDSLHIEDFSEVTKTAIMILSTITVDPNLMSEGVYR